MVRHPKSTSSYRRLAPAENVKAGFSAKARRYVKKDVSRIGKRTATISHRQHETLRTKERYHIATPEFATEARKRGALKYSSAVQRESVAKAAFTREGKKYRIALEARDGQYIEANNPRRRRERVHITAAAIERYLENRRKRLNGEFIPEGDWQQMMDIARAVGDARGELLRGSPGAFGFRGPV
jgi:hypothetical protein